MKKYRVNMFLYLVFPVIVISIILTYGAFLFKQSYAWVNVVNIAFDIIILIYYLYKFCYEVDIIDRDLVFYIFLKKYKIPKYQVKKITYTSFLIRIATENRNFYISAFPRDINMLRKLFKDVNKQL